jgi:hypothetical protein
MKKQSVFTICFSLILALVASLPVPARSSSVAQFRGPRDVRVMVVIPETIIQLPRPPDPAAETEMIKRFTAAGFSVLNPVAYAGLREDILQAYRRGDITYVQALGRQFGVHVVIVGEGLAQIAFRDGRLWVARGRVEAGAISTDDSIVIDADGKEATARDIADVIAGKAALRTAGGVLADQFICRVGQRFNVQPVPRAIPRVGCAVLRSNAPGLSRDIDFGGILTEYLVKLGTCDVIASGQDLETLLSNVHAGTIRVPDVVFICSVERAEIVNLGGGCTGGRCAGSICAYVNRVTFGVRVSVVETESLTVLAADYFEGTKWGIDLTLRIDCITVELFDRTLLGKLAREVLEKAAQKMEPAALCYLLPASYFDIATMKNGDRLGGYIQNPYLTINPPYGRFLIPIADIEWVRFCPTARIRKVTGEEISGPIEEQTLTLSGWGNLPMNQVKTLVCSLK